MGREAVTLNTKEILLELRTRNGFSQEQLAAWLQLEGLSINQKAISRIETGERVVADYELLYLAKVLRVRVEDLLGKE